MSLTAGDLISAKYRIVRLIGDGGMGTVYQARHELLGVPVALKSLHADLAKRPGLAARFLQEARVSATIQSPHVVRVTDVDTLPDGSPYLVMELLSGESLQAMLTRQGKLSPDQALDFALQILSGLEAAHALGVVHRDLKPDNVFVTVSRSGPVLKLIDFGIAKLRESSEFKKDLTRAGVIMGTPEYMAPEQLYGAHQVDHRADLYSLGVMLFEMLSGVRPADGDSAEAIVARVMAANVQHLSDLEPALPEALVKAVERALSPDREQRFASAYDMRMELARMAGELSAAGRLAASPARAATAAAPPQQPQNPSPAQLAAVADTVDGPAPGAVPETLPPERPGLQRVATGTQAAAPPAIAQPAWQQPVLPTARARPRRPRKRMLPLLLGLGSVILLGAGVIVFTQTMLPVRQQIPDLPAFEAAAPTATTAGGPVTVAPLGTATPTPIQALPEAPNHASAPASRPRTSPPATESAGGHTASSPLPFPSFALPTSLPPLPSGFPTSLPNILPTALPSSLIPQIPGLTVPNTPAAPAPTSSAK